MQINLQSQCKQQTIASYLRSGDEIRRVVEKSECEYNVIVSVKKVEKVSKLIAVVENAD